MNLVVFDDFFVFEGFGGFGHLGNLVVFGRILGIGGFGSIWAHFQDLE